jgi:hypothetical protein
MGHWRTWVAPDARASYVARDLGNGKRAPGRIARAHNEGQLVASENASELTPVDFECFVKELLDAMDHEDAGQTMIRASTLWRASSLRLHKS